MFCLKQQADLLAVFFYHFSDAMLGAVMAVHLLLCSVLKRRCNNLCDLRLQNEGHALSEYVTEESFN